MIHAIFITIVAIWFLWGAFNVIWGIAQIVCGLICGVAAAGLYALAYSVELTFKVAGKLRGSFKRTV